MKKTYNMLMNRLQPGMSEDELFSSVLRRSRDLFSVEPEGKKVYEMKKTGKKAILIPIAGALVAATSIGVFAATYNKNIKTSYEAAAEYGASIFDQPIVNAESEPMELTEKANFDYEGYSYIVDKTFDFDNYSLNVRGAICDGETLQLIYDMEFGEDFQFSGNCVDTRISVENRPVGGGYAIQGSNINGHVYSDLYMLKLNSVPDDVLKFTFESFDNWANFGYGGSKEYPLGVTIEIPKADLKFCNNKTITVPEGTKTVFSRTPDKLGELGEWSVDSVFISDLGVMPTFSTDHEITQRELKDKPYCIGFDIVLIFKDGSRMEVNDSRFGIGTSSDGNQLTVRKLFNYPIDLNEVESIEINEISIPVNE